MRVAGSGFKLAQVELRQSLSCSCSSSLALTVALTPDRNSSARAPATLQVEPTGKPIVWNKFAPVQYLSVGKESTSSRGTRRLRR